MTDWTCPGCAATRPAAGTFICECGVYGFDEPSTQLEAPRVIARKDRPLEVEVDEPVALSEDGQSIIFTCGECSTEVASPLDGLPEIFACLHPDCPAPWTYDPAREGEPIFDIKKHRFELISLKK